MIIPYQFPFYFSGRVELFHFIYMVFNVEFAACFLIRVLLSSDFIITGVGFFELPLGLVVESGYFLA
jgi:hypothetical protein